MPLTGLFDLARAQEIDFLKVDIEGSERDVFAAASRIVGRFKRIAMEYHDQIVPGTLELLRRVLGRRTRSQFVQQQWKVAESCWRAVVIVADENPCLTPGDQSSTRHHPPNLAPRVLPCCRISFPGHHRPTPEDGRAIFELVHRLGCYSALLYFSTEKPRTGADRVHAVGTNVRRSSSRRPQISARQILDRLIGPSQERNFCCAARSDFPGKRYPFSMSYDRIGAGQNYLSEARRVKADFVILPSFMLHYAAPLKRGGFE